MCENDLLVIMSIIKGALMSGKHEKFGGKKSKKLRFSNTINYSNTSNYLNFSGWFQSSENTFFS